MKNKITANWLISKGIIALLALSLAPQSPAAVVSLNLGEAANFAVLAGSAITIAGPVNSTNIIGDIGSFPTPSITGLENLVLVGDNHAGDAVTQLAKADLLIAYIQATSLLAGAAPQGDGLVLSGTLLAGAYKGAGSISINGTEPGPENQARS